ncbi:MAG: efflux RND transporter permease subunit, partial [candidate division Zixibacteria bacterium]|nr:efflux RND transporter permease subunit [candidate division Zixibacteria bacterium]
MHKLARFSVNYPTTVIMMVLAILLLGYISLTRLGVDLLPDLNNPRLFIDVKAGDRPPLEMEHDFVEPIEALAARQHKVQNVSSISRVGRAQIVVEYSFSADMDEALLDLNRALADFSANSDVDELTVSQHDPNAAPILLLALSHEEIDDLNELRKTAETVIRNDLIRLEGVAAVEIVGARRAEVEISTDAYTLQAYGLTADQLATRIESYNRSISGGSIVEMGLKYLIKGVGEFSDLDDLRNLIVAYKTEGS